MNKHLDRFFLSVLILISRYLYTFLASFCLVMIAFLWFIHDSEPSDQVTGTSETQARKELPDPLSDVPNLLEDMENSAGEEFRIGKSLVSSIDELEKLIVAVITDQSTINSSLISGRFTAKGIDRETHQSKFTDDDITVHRWLANNAASVFDGRDPFLRLVNNLFEPWIGSPDFRIEMKAFSRNQVGEFVFAKLVVEACGSTMAGRGVQSTSIWDTTWKIRSQGLTLESLQVQAQEVVAADVDDGRLLVDCTQSIIENCEAIQEQLAYGLDHWSGRFPNIDIVGDHGIAVGDINRDGLDDLYVCQPQGLPNCLLIQNPDGTVDDASKGGNVDILDHSVAALMIDIDNDQDQDLVVATDGNLLLLSNNGKGEFQLERSLPIGRNTNSLSAADFDRDGDLDLFLCKSQDVNRQSDLLRFPAKIESADDGGCNVLLRKDEGWNFTDATEECGLTTRNNFWTRSAIWHDFDDDGDLDLYVTNEFMTDQLFENRDGWFADVSQRMGLNVAARHRSVSLGEFNQDGRLDYFVATDVPLPAYRQFRRLQNKSLDTDLSPEATEMLLGESQVWLTGAADEKFHPFFLRAPIFSCQSANGSTTADLNNDGLDDVVVTNGMVTRSASEDLDELFYTNLFAQSATDPLGAEAGKLPLDWEDQNLSDRLTRRAHEVSDLVRVGYSFSALQRNRCFLSIRGLGFANFSALSGLDFPDDARAVATTDWDCDGDPDIVMTCRGGPQIRILCNQLNSENGYLQLDLIGTESNADAIGARVKVYLQARSAPLVKSLLAGSGSLSQSTKRLMFGLGKSQTIERVDVIWPTGKTQSFEGLVPNARYEITEGDSRFSEKTNQRVQLKINPGPLSNRQLLPVVGGRSVF